jgi:hypothetical protein
MEQRVSLITLGVADVAVSRAFYRALGWEPTMDLGETVFFQAGGMIVALWGRDELAADGVLDDTGGWGGITLSYNVGSPAEVHEVIEVARAAGATIAREPGEAFWGGFTAVFHDPDGHPWEIAHNPSWELGAAGSGRIP